MKYEVVFTEDFEISFTLAIEYIQNELSSPIAAQNFQNAVLELIEKTSFNPTIAIRRLSFEGVDCYMISHNQWNVYYSVENNTMKVLDLVHQSQSASF